MPRRSHCASDATSVRGIQGVRDLNRARAFYEKLGYEAWYVEDHGANPYDPRISSVVMDCDYNVGYLRTAMERHGFGRGCYRYFRYPLPDPVQELREFLYSGLSEIANEWAEALGAEVHRAPHDGRVAGRHAAAAARAGSSALPPRQEPPPDRCRPATTRRPPP